MLRDKPDYLRRQPGISPCARFLVGATAMALSAFPGHTLAYRPFTSTDADVVDARELEVEVGYLTVERNAGETGYIAPSVVLNYGLLDTLELVGEFEWHKPPDASWEIANPGIFLKELPKKGVLQGQPGLGIAVEAGALLPTNEDDEKHVGGEVILIASGNFASFIYHINLGGGVDRARNGFWKWGVIGEVPVSNTLALVGEIAGEDPADAEPEQSALIGARFLPPESGIAFDMGVRRGLSSRAADWAVTLGFTLSF